MLDLDKIFVNFISYTAKQAIDEIINIAGWATVDEYVSSLITKDVLYVDDDFSDDNFIYNDAEDK